METLFIAKDASLARRENTLVVATPGSERMRLPVERVRHIVLLGASTLDTALLSLCAEHGIRVSVLDWYGGYRGTFEPRDRQPSGEVKLRHAKAVLTETIRLSLAQRIVLGAGRNMVGNLRYHRYRGKVELDPLIAAINDRLLRIDKTKAIPELMGLEGQIRAFYFDAWPIIDQALTFAPRIRRPPNNPINCLMSFLNGMLYATARHELGKTHLEASFSFLHAPGLRRASLALDLAEPFRPIAVDRLIFRLVRKGMMNADWFDQQPGVCLLTETGRRQVAQAFSQRLEEPGPDGKALRERIWREALGIEREILGVGKYKPFVPNV